MSRSIIPLSALSDARQRALRVYLTGLLIDVAGTAVTALVAYLGVIHWTREYWVAAGALTLRTAIHAAVVYVARYAVPPA
jgi:hypothetical protein